jgi:hypothetical protein
MNVKRIIPPLVLVSGLLIAVAATIVIAEKGYDDQGNVNDPRVNPRANACYEGGSLEGKCDTDIEWIAGWYLIRYEYMMISRSEFPKYLEWVLPPEVSPNQAVGTRTPPSTYTPASTRTAAPPTNTPTPLP